MHAYLQTALFLTFSIALSSNLIVKIDLNLTLMSYEFHYSPFTFHEEYYINGILCNSRGKNLVFMSHHGLLKSRICIISLNYHYLELVY